MRQNNFFIFIFICTLFRCGLSDNDAPLPAYLTLENPTVTSTDIQGANTHKITDVWVIENGQIQGIYPLPAKVPLITKSEPSEIILLAGIRKNGINDTPAFYPFYKSITTETNLQPGEIKNIPLAFTYADNIKFDVIADFEQVNLFGFDLDNDPNTNMTVTSTTAASGTKSGYVFLNDTTQLVEVATTEIFQKTSLISGNAYIELDYKGNAEIAIGLVSYFRGATNGSLSYKVIVVPREEWNKVYIDITEEISSSSLDKYQLAFGFSRPSNTGQVEAFIDNVKLLRF